uniref:WAS/WASL-interacting protein family member 1-like n=2 Tax=Macaca TaxID=9539 RepID=UPI0010A21FE1|nr:WAS/WASL-interacting protein family member 1-like [Macaca mulatta]
MVASNREEPRQALGLFPLPVGGFQIRLLQRPLEAALRSRPASGLGEGGSVYTCHEGGGGRARKPEQSPKLLNSSRENAARAELWAGGSKGAGRAGGGRGGKDSHFPGRCSGWRGGGRALRAPPAAFPHSPQKRAEPKSGARRPAEPAPSSQPPVPRRADAPGPGEGPAAGPGPVPTPSFPGAARGAERRRLPGSFGAAAMGMAQGPGEELAPRGRTVYSDAELVKAEGRLLTALSAQQPHGRPPGVSPLPRDPHPTTLRPLPPPPPPPPPRRPPAHSTHSPIMQRGNRCRRHVTSGRRWLGRDRALVGAVGWGRTLQGNWCHRTLTPAQALSYRTPAAILGAGKLPFPFTSLRVIEL